MRIKKGDTVVVIAGKDKGKRGKVLQVLPKKNKIIVEGINIVTKHQRPDQQLQQGGIINQESAIDISNVMFWDKKAGQGARIGYKFLDNGEKVRMSKKTGEEID